LKKDVVLRILKRDVYWLVV